MLQILDGALGTELERRGVETTGAEWTSRAILTNPNLIRTIHEEYILVGADIITAGTFRTNPRSHGSTGLDARDLTKRALSLAAQARDHVSVNVKIAGSIAPVEDCFRPDLTPEDDEILLNEHKIFSEWLGEFGADIILIETMSTLREAGIALRATREISGLPVYVSIVIGADEKMLDGSTLEEAFDRLSTADLIAINCTPLSIVQEIAPRFAALAKERKIPFGFYPNASESNLNATWNLLAHSDEEFAHEAIVWRELGASLMGSCCGTTPSTTGAICEAIQSG